MGSVGSGRTTLGRKLGGLDDSIHISQKLSLNRNPSLDNGVFDLIVFMVDLTSKASLALLKDNLDCVGTLYYLGRVAVVATKGNNIIKHGIRGDHT